MRRASALSSSPRSRANEPERVDHLALLVHDVVVLQQPLPLLEILELDPLLRLPDGAGDQSTGNDLARFRPTLIHPAGNPVGAEKPHQIVFQRQEEDRLPRVALAAGASPQLPVDPARLVALGADDVQPGLRLCQIEIPCPF